MTGVTWRSLEQEMAAWHAAGLTLPFWWRDDDAIAPTAALEDLARRAQAAEMPIHLAVIPQKAEARLAPWLQDTPFRCVVHGWAHSNHAPEGAKSAEFGQNRAGAETELRNGLSRLRDLFGDACHPMFVPPWNRLAEDLLPAVVAAGHNSVSTFGPRKRAHPVPGLLQINTHIDPVDWRGTRSAVTPDHLLPPLLRHLKDRRNGHADNTEPLGLLTHHLMQDAATWDVCHGLLSTIRSGPIAVFDLATHKDTK